MKSEDGCNKLLRSMTWSNVLTTYFFLWPLSKVSDAMRFTAYNQYIHRMFRRRGPNSKELDAIRSHLTSQGIECAATPCIGGIEVDLPGLYQAVEQLGGPMNVLEKNLWPKVADMLKVLTKITILRFRFLERVCDWPIYVWMNIRVHYLKKRVV